MKLRLLVALLSAGWLAAACAQDNTSTPTSSAAATSSLSPSGRGPGLLFDRLGLTDEQQVAVKAVFEAHRAERETIRQARQSGASRDELRAKHEALAARIHEDLKGILTEAQIQQLEEWHKQRGARPQGPATEAERAARLDQRMERLTEKLALTAEQQEQLRALWATRQADRGSGAMGPRPTAEERLARHEARQAQMREILTEEQLAKWQELKPLGRGMGVPRARQEG
jgi:Spy/CpxP family protein refolding chaperone